jgi:hypothetical protein
MEGIHRRVGEVVKQDEPITIEILVAVLALLESRWQQEIRKPGPERDYVKLRLIALTAFWFCAGFCAGLRGEEMPLLEFEGTFKSLENIANPKCGLPPHFDLVISGPTKGKQLSGSKFAIPVVAVTGGNGIQAGRWATRYCQLERMMGKKNGRLFTMKLANGKLHEFEELFYSVLEDVHEAKPDLFPEDVNIREDFGILRSLRRGVTTHALNLRLDRELLEAINRWRHEMNSLGLGRLDMPNVYAKLESIKALVLSFSGSL